VCAVCAVRGAGVDLDRAAILGRRVAQARDLRLEIAFVAWNSLPRRLTTAAGACLTAVDEMLRSGAG
jgi:hypothetical protein